VKKLTDDIAALRPTLFVAVPRVLERIQSGIQAKLKAKPWLVRTLVGLAMRWKMARVRAGVPLLRVRPEPKGPFPVKSASWARHQCSRQELLPRA
jgi:long-chain acyl-CoA synthetase